MSNPNPKNQFEKGRSGNPGGRPKKGEAIKDIISAVGESKYDDRKTYWEKLSEVMFTTAIKKAEPALAKYLIDRLLGKPKEQIDANVNGDINITINKIVDDE